jgi:hypothetical protein
MKLILKRIEKPVDVNALSDLEPRHIPCAGPFGLHTEDGELLPCQVSTSMDSRAGGHPVTLTVTFTVDGNQIKVQGDE